jgi:hypothetical protein
MRWRWPPPRRGDIAAVVLLAAILASAILAVAKLSDSASGRGSTFGPDWNCTSAGAGDLVCIKRPQGKPAKPE